MSDNPLATSPQDQPVVNEHATLARECSSRQNAWNNKTEAAEFVKHYHEVYRLTGNPRLAPYLSGGR
jgi:hypothetical protein